MPLDWMGVEGKKKSKACTPLPPFQNLDGTIFGKVVDAPLFCTGEKGKGVEESAAIFITFVEEKEKKEIHMPRLIYSQTWMHINNVDLNAPKKSCLFSSSVVYSVPAASQQT